MSGPRDYDWKHTRVVGDRDAAVPYLSYANKLLGFVKQEAARNDLDVHQITRKLDDGTIVVAEIHGSIPRITIAPKGGASIGTDWAEGLVIVAVDESCVIVEDLEDGRTLGLFESNKTATYAAASTPKGIWATVQPEAYNKVASGNHAQNTRRYGLDGIYDCHLHALSHINEKGESCNWFGQELGNYFYPANILPQQRAIWSVSSRGRMLYDTRADDTNPHGQSMQVMGAAIKDNWLYVATAYAFYVLNYDDIASDPNPQESFVPKGAYAGNFPVRIIRIKLLEALDPETLHAYYAPSEELEVLFYGALHNADCPWVFNEAVTEVVCVARPDENRLLWSYKHGQEGDFFETNDVVPSETHLVHRFNLQTGSMTTEDAGDLVAEDSGNQLRLERTSPTTWDYVYGERRWRAVDTTSDGSFFFRYLAAADLRYGRFVFYCVENFSETRKRRWTEIDADGQVQRDNDGTYASTYRVRELGERLSHLVISAYAMLQLRGCGPLKYVKRFVDNGIDTTDFHPSDDTPGVIINNNDDSISFNAATPPRGIPHVVAPLLLYDVTTSGDDVQVMFGGVAYCQAIYNFDPDKEFEVVYFPRDLPDEPSSLNSRAWYVQTYIRDCAIGFTKDRAVVYGEIGYGLPVKYMTNANVTAVTGDLARFSAWGAQVWGKPPVSQKRRYIKN